MPLEACEVISTGPGKMSFCATPMTVRAALAHARSTWRANSVDENLCETGEQVLAEVLNNIVEHAMAGRPKGVVELETDTADGGMICTVRDDGAPMPGLVLPPGLFADLGEEVEALPEDGFGWFMIRSLTNDLEYSRCEGWNCLQFSIAADSSYSAPRIY